MPARNTSGALEPRQNKPPCVGQTRICQTRILSCPRKSLTHNAHMRNPRPAAHAYAKPQSGPITIGRKIPAMPLFPNLEKLINEHGSASILRERLLLAEDKYAALQERLTMAHEETTWLKEELKDARERIQTLEQSTPPPVSVSAVSEEEGRILIHLVQSDRWLTSSAIAQHLGITKAKVDFFLTRFEERSWVSGSHNWAGLESEYKIGQDGRGYLISKGLLK